jgi:hypothetical protein
MLSLGLRPLTCEENLKFLNCANLLVWAYLHVLIIDTLIDCRIRFMVIWVLKVFLMAGVNDNVIFHQADSFTFYNVQTTY